MFYCNQCTIVQGFWKERERDSFGILYTGYLLSIVKIIRDVEIVRKREEREGKREREREREERERERERKERGKREERERKREKEREKEERETKRWTIKCDLR